MALVERLMGLNNDGSSLDGAYQISIEVLTSMAIELINSKVSRDDIRTEFNMSPEDDAEFTALLNAAPNVAAMGLPEELLPILGPTIQFLYMKRIYAVFILAETRTPGYTNPTEVRVKLGLPNP
jgi:hypothetical protein